MTTTTAEDETSAGNPENSKRDAVDVAPSVPAPEDEAAAEPTTTEPTRRNQQQRNQQRRNQQRRNQQRRNQQRRNQQRRNQQRRNQQRRNQQRRNQQGGINNGGTNNDGTNNGGTNNGGTNNDGTNNGGTNNDGTNNGGTNNGRTSTTWTGSSGVDMTLDNPTDRALFQLGTLPTELRTTIIHHGTCRPKEQFAISSENGNRRIFSEKHYHAHSGAIKIERQWLCFSPTTKNPYCQRCWYFGDPSAMQNEWTNSVSGYPKNFGVKSHEKT